MFEKMHERIEIRRTEDATDLERSDGRIFDDELAGVVAVELRDGVRERRVAEGEHATAPSEALLDLGERMFLNDYIIIADASHRAGGKNPDAFEARFRRGLF